MKSLRLTEQQLLAIRRRGKAQKVVFGTGPQERKKRDKPEVDYARALAQQIKEAGLPLPILEYAFDKQLEGAGRGWQFDMCWKDQLLACEVDGAVHRIKKKDSKTISRNSNALLR